MKNSKKILALLLALVMVFSLAACGEKTNDDKDKPEDKPAVEENTDGEDETTDEETVDGEITKVGVGSLVSLAKSKDLDEDKGQAQEDLTVAAVAFDKDGKVVKVEIDTMQNKAVVKDDGTFDFDLEAKGKTKKELGEDYPMKDASEIDKNWDEQIVALEDYVVGKTVEEIKNIPVEEKDAGHPAVPTEADLKASVTITIEAYQEAIANAWDNAVDVENVEKIGLGIVSEYGKGSKEAEEDKGAAVQFNSTFAVVALDKEDKIVKTLVDVAQNTVAFTKEGGLETDVNKPGTTKKELGSEYGMKDASEIGKEWDEQIVVLEDWTIGKTKEDISSLELDENQVAKDADLKAGITVSLTGYQEAILKAIENVK